MATLSRILEQLRHAEKQQHNATKNFYRRQRASESAVGDDIPVANCADGSDRKIDCLRKTQAAKRFCHFEMGLRCVHRDKPSLRNLELLGQHYGRGPVRTVARSYSFGDTTTLENCAHADEVDNGRAPHRSMSNCRNPDGFEGGQVVQQARRAKPTLPIIARAHSEEEVEHLKRHGASHVILGEDEMAKAILALVPQ